MDVRVTITAPIDSLTEEEAWALRQQLKAELVEQLKEVQAEGTDFDTFLGLWERTAVNEGLPEQFMIDLMREAWTEFEQQG